MEINCSTCKHNNMDFCNGGNCDKSYSKWEAKEEYINSLIEEIEPNFDTLKPSHYNSGKYDVIWFCQYHNLPFDVGNVIKYVFRAGKKDKDKEIQDLEKAIEYIKRRIEHLKGE